MADDTTTSTDTTEESVTDESTENGAQAAEQPKETGGSKIPPEVERALKKANDEAKTYRLKLKEFEDRGKTEAQRLAEARTEAEQRAATAEQSLLRYKVAAAKKLPVELAGRLQGATEDEMSADADALLKALKPQAPSFDGGVRKPTAGPVDMNSLIRQKAGLS